MVRAVVGVRLLLVVMSGARVVIEGFGVARVCVSLSRLCCQDQRDKRASRRGK